MARHRLRLGLQCVLLGAVWDAGRRDEGAATPQPPHVSHPLRHQRRPPRPSRSGARALGLMTSQPLGLTLLPTSAVAMAACMLAVSLPLVRVMVVPVAATRSAWRVCECVCVRLCVSREVVCLSRDEGGVSSRICTSRHLPCLVHLLLSIVDVLINNAHRSHFTTKMKE